eukprot:CAMPEP_0119095312 /NCGR_PEP_ID=MMETSP1178-20130426/169101_1 /TAXON_ID=33656 /ORGANISM="unid sp, Strain CCMP2000" /LENGTH=45 /DNA_ID= /DNA_START= /DNA_END= /DNA_ORIENTATION=
MTPKGVNVRSWRTRPQVASSLQVTPQLTIRRAIMTMERIRKIPMK